MGIFETMPDHFAVTLKLTSTPFAGLWISAQAVEDSWIIHKKGSKAKFRAMQGCECKSE
jgi:hypothetical protein